MGYAQRAAGLADRLRSELGLTVSLQEGSKGAYEIHADGQAVYSKTETRRIPKPDDIVALLGERLRTSGSLPD